MTRMYTHAAIVGLIALVALACHQQGVAGQPVPPGPSPLDTARTAEDVIVVDESRLDEIRAKYTLSEPLGDVSAVATCESGSASDAKCTEAAQQHLREAAAAQEANLAVVTGSALMQSFPTRLSLKATLYRATSR